MPRTASSRKSPPCSKGARNIRYILKRIGAKILDILVRIYHIPFGFGHLRPFFYEKSVRAKLREGLFKMKFAGLMESHSDENAHREDGERNAPAPPVYKLTGNHFFVISGFQALFFSFTLG